jgi:hypothetical protein
VRKWFSGSGECRVLSGAAAGLPRPSRVRAKIGTAENRFVARRIGTLSKADREPVPRSFGEILVPFCSRGEG